MKYLIAFGFLMILAAVLWQLSMPAEIAVTPRARAVVLTDEQATELMYRLSGNERNQASSAMDEVLAADDRRFIAVLIELMRASQIPLMTTPLEYREYVDVLTSLSRQRFGGNWGAWIEWYGGSELVPPPGFTGWKGQLLGQIDVGFADFLRDDLPSSIRTEEILWGGVRVDGIPALQDAKMIAPAQASYLELSEPVFGISINGDSRAYPLRILDWHEMANDVVGGVPVSLAYCTLCGAAIAYDGRASDGNSYTFGSSGFLFRSNKLMYDHQTRTLWNQFTGEPVLGELVGSDVKLSLLPVVLTTWQEWLAQHPDTVVLDINTGYPRDYLPGFAYGDYFSDPDTMFPVWQRSDAQATKSQIYGLTLEGISKAYPIETLANEQVVNDTIGSTQIVLVATRGIVSVDAISRRTGAVTYNAGSEVRAYQRAEHTFRPSQDANTLLDANNQPWQVTEEALIGANGERLPRINGHLAYWFGWYAFFPETEVYEE